MDLFDSWFESIRNGNLKEIINIFKTNPDFINKFTTMNDGRNVSVNAGMCIQKDILDPAFLDEQNKAYLVDTSSYRKIDSNGFDIMSRQHDREIEEIKPVKLNKAKIITEYDNELKRRRQDLLKKMRRTAEPVNTLGPLIRKLSQSENDSEKIMVVKELIMICNQDGGVPQNKFSDQMINILELCICDSSSSDEFIVLSGKLMMSLLHLNIRRGDAAIVDFWCRIFDKMTNLQIEQYTQQILKMLLKMIECSTEGVINNLKSNKDTFLKNWEYFFENLCFPKCLNLSLMILKSVFNHCPDVVIDRFHNVIDIMIGWCIHPDTDLVTMEALCQRSVDLHECWISDTINLKKTLSNLQKDFLTHCQMLSRIHRIDKDRSQIDDLKLKIKFFCFALSCVTAGVSKISDLNDVNFHENSSENLTEILSNVYIISIIEKITEGLIMCSKQIDFDNLLLQPNSVILHLLFILNKKEPIGTVYQSVFRYVLGTTLPLQSHILSEGSNNTNYYNKQLIISYLDLISICLVNINLEPATVVQILSPVNWIHSCIFYGSFIDNNLMQKYLRLVDIIAKSHCVTTFYQILLSDLELALNILMKISNCTNMVRLVQSNAFKAKSYETPQAELVVKYNINLIIMLYNRLSDPSILVPSIPVLFTKYLLFTESNIIVKYPNIASFLISTISKIKLSHDLIPDWIKFLCLIINTGNLSFAIKSMGFEILKTVLATNKSILENSTELINLLVSSVCNLMSSESEKESIVVSCLNIIVDNLNSYQTLINETNIDNLVAVNIIFSMHSSHLVRSKSIKIYFDLITKTDSPISRKLFHKNLKSIQAISISGRSFKFPIDFSKSIFNWIIDSTDKYSFESRDIQRLHSIVAINQSKLEHLFCNRMIMVYEIIINACWDCVRQKLKFDQNADSRITLMTIENMVKSILTNGNSLKAITDKRFRKLMTKFTSKTPEDQSLSVNLMILLLDVLEKMFYNCYEGCCLGFPPVNKSIETFFVTNKNVCIEWFIKMRLFIVALAQYSGQWSTVIWHGMQLLKFHLDKCNTHSSSAAKILVPEVEDCIVLTSMAYSKLGNWENLYGLSQLSVETYGSKFDWIEALADKTIGRLEMALSKFEEYVRNHHDPERIKLSSEMRLLTRKTTSHSSFILCMEEIADCYKLLNNPDGLDQWKKQIQSWKSNSQIQEAQKLSINWARLVCLTKLSKWDENMDDKCIPLRANELSWKYRSVIDNCEDSLFLSVVEKSSCKEVEIESFIVKLSSIQSICDFPNTFTNPDIILINERLKLLKAANKGESFIVDCKNLSNFSTTLPLPVISFCNTIQKRYNIPQCFPNQKFLIKWHRNHLNFNKCHSLISHSFTSFLGKEINQQSNLSNSQLPIIQMQIERELVKLLWEEDKKKDSLQLLTSSLKDSLLFETSDSTLHSSKCQLNTKSLLTLFMWLCNEKSKFPKFCNDAKISSNLQFLIELAEVPWINGLPLVSPQHRSMEKTCQSSVTDVCSQLLILASKSRNQDNSDKSFMALAQWCLSRSRSLDEIGFNAETIDLATKLENQGFSSETICNIELLLKSNFCPSQMKTESDWFGDCYEDSGFLVELRQSILALDPEITSQMAEEVVKIWLEFVTHHFSLHIAAAEAYFSFLKDATPTKAKYSLCNKNKTTANLRILSLIGKRSRSLRDSIINKIKTSPPGSWTNVIPQLFARLKHSDKMIRNCMSELLQRLAISSNNCSKLIIYPTLVGSISENMNNSSPYHDIKKVLVENNRQLVEEVGVFIKELRRITVLWDELWVSSLGQCYDELNKKAHQLQSEIDKIDSQDDLKHKDVILKLKYNSIIQAAVFILERTKNATNMIPETPRESWFHNMFAEEITSTIEEIKSPNNIREFNDAWKKIKTLQELILTESNDNIKVKLKRGRHQFLSLKLDDVSPGLAKINSSLIPLPGMNNKSLLSIDKHISILPTKTKPKKFRFLSTNGKHYSYLYKGLEDLRLDERVMQILGIANTMFSKINEHESNKYHITTYPVTPLGTRAGLIQMVEEATSLFSLYKRHQMRNKNTFDHLKSKACHSNNGDIVNESTIISEEGHPIRPTDIYWQKLRPKLEAAKIDIGIDSREKWPMNILIEVFNELNRDTSPDLLSKELWCCSINSNNWYRSSINFTRSCAVMCIMGHCLGLGDRHLDNLLVNFSNGQMIHIDYNVCFDKGVSLKVPEKVPFRLTDIITNVFGPMAVNGLFRISCENVYEIIQQSQDSILTLMDMFIFDPIVDWSSGIESGHYGSFDGGKYAVNSSKSLIDKRSVEFIINLNNFQSVFITIEDDLKSCQEKLILDFRNLHEHLNRSWSTCKTIEEIKAAHNKKLQMIQYLRGYETNNECKIVEQFNYVRKLEERSMHLELDIQKRQQQLKLVSMEHSAFFNKILSAADFISLKLDIKNIKNFFEEHIENIEKSITVFCDQYSVTNPYEEIIQELLFMLDNMEEIQNGLIVLEKYRNIIQEMPQSYYNSDRCSYMLQITENLLKTPSLSNIQRNFQNYSDWMIKDDQSSIEKFTNEKNNWNALLKVQVELQEELQSKLILQSHEDEIPELESIWQLTVYENVAGINLFKSILLEQYLEMANITSQLDGNVISKIPEFTTTSFTVDYNASLRKYLQLLSAHENYFKILTNSMNMFGIYLNTNEAGMVCNMMVTLQKACINILTFESKFIDIIMPESIKIMKQLTAEDNELLNKLKSILKDGENIMLHFNIALTSASYDVNNYEHIHLKTVVPMKEKIAELTDIGNFPIHDSSKQLRILIASFYTTINQSYLLVCDFIDCCMGSSTPSSWNYIDLVAASSINISPIWNKSIKLLKDALYMSGIRCMVSTLDHCKSIIDSLTIKQDQSQLVILFNNILRNLEIYFNFITKHVLVGVGSQCFAKMFCLLLEHAGWNIDTLISENVINNCALSADYICGSVISFRKLEYPNANNFYNQLQFRFNNYKNIAGFSIIEPNTISQRFQTRNAAFHKSLTGLARNQLLSLCWTKKHLINEIDLKNCDLLPLEELINILNGIPNRITALKELLSKLDTISSKFLLADEKLLSEMKEDSKDAIICRLNQERTQSINSVKKRILLFNDALLNIDRFECLRSASGRGNQFDEEVIQFLSESKDLLQKLSECEGLIKPIEEEIIKLKEEYKLSSDTDWYVELLEILQKDMDKNSNEVHQKENQMKEIIISNEKEARGLKENLSADYYPLINHLKPNLRILYTVTKKLKSYLSIDESTSGTNKQDIKSKVDRVLKIMSLFEKFNFTMDGLMKFLLKGGDGEISIYEYIGQLHYQINNLAIIKDSIVPDLFITLLSLSPLETEDKSSIYIYDFDIPSKFGFSNNNMAEINGAADTMTTRISPSLSGEETSSIVENNKSNPINNIINSESDIVGKRSTDINLEIIEKDEKDKKYNNNNSVAVQKAIEVWKLTETRLNSANQKQPLASNEYIEIKTSKPAINQYIDKLIKSARSAENLARMYEGWTAWV
uniref:non-specific serine/threonine protein kinase n=1 Tax=Schmidtea mediterranea TaxID=79327 RepID=H9XVZ7_SCHMD|nr:SMG-1 [Schmidtea mediterranea]